MRTTVNSLSYLALASVVLAGCMTASNPATAQQDKAPNDLEIAHISRAKPPTFFKIPPPATPAQILG